MLQGIERSVLSFFILSSSALRSRQLISHSLFLFFFQVLQLYFPLLTHTHKHTHSLKQRTQAIKDYRRYEIKSPKKQIKFSIYKKSLRIGKNKTGKQINKQKGNFDSACQTAEFQNVTSAKTKAQQEKQQQRYQLQLRLQQPQ